MIDEDDEAELDALFAPIIVKYVKTPKVLHGVTISNNMLFSGNMYGFSGQKLDYQLLTRVVSVVLGGDAEDDDWEQAVISSTGGYRGTAVVYSYPINSNKKFYRCLNLDCGVNSKVDARLLGIAATIHAHIYLSQKTSDYDIQRKHLNAAGGLRDYCYQVAGRAGFEEFTLTLCELLCADLLTFYEDEEDEQY